MRRAFGAIELIAVGCVLAVIVLIAAVVIPAITVRRPVTDRGMMDVTCVRGILQGMVIWAQNNDGYLPLPSRIDVDDLTVPELGRAKDTTANIDSLLIYNGFIPTEMLISRSEPNPSIAECRSYEFDTPSSAVNPMRA